MKAKIKNITLNELNKIAKELKIDGNKELWLASDEEGNSFGPLVQIDNRANLEVTKDKIILYPVSGYETEFDD